MFIDRFLQMFDFLSVLLRAATLTFQTLVIGGVGFVTLALRPSGTEAVGLERTCRTWIRRAAIALAATQALYVATDLLVLTPSAGLTFREAIGADFVYAAALSAAAALSIAYLASGERERSSAGMLVSAGLILVSSVMTSHAIARMNHRAPLALLTWLHQGATAVWIGGLPFLLFVLYRARTAEFLRATTRQFSRLAFTSVCILAAAGVGLGWEYVGSLSAFYGTAYGAMLGGKFALFAFLLSLGGMNFLIARTSPGEYSAGVNRIRKFCEAEIGIGLTVLLAAASLTSQPPAADLTTDRLTAREIATRMAPHWPRLTSPSLAEETSDALELPAGIRPSDPGYPAVLAEATNAHIRAHLLADIAWSEYNHRWAGIIVLGIGILAFLARTNRVPLARNWPLLFIGLAVFLFLRSDPDTWPLGHHATFWESWLNPEDVQHRLFILLIIFIAVFEWRVQTGRVAGQVAPLVFPALCLLAGAALMTHSHSFGNVKEDLYAELSHLPIAILGVLAGWSRWLEVRLPAGDRAKPSLGWIWPVCFVFVGAILLNYREM